MGAEVAQLGWDLQVPRSIPSTWDACGAQHALRKTHMSTKTGNERSLPDTKRPSPPQHEPQAQIFVAAVNAAGAVSPGEASSGD